MLCVITFASFNCLRVLAKYCLLSVVIAKCLSVLAKCHMLHAHGPNHPSACLVNRELFSLAWAEPSVYATRASGLRGPKQLTNCNC